MPKTTFASENKVSQGGPTFPVLKFVKDEKARIVCVEQQPEFGYAHRLVAPKIANGQVVMETKSRKDGSEFDVYDMDFISMPTCLGDLSILQERGVDPDNCPVCKKSMESEHFLPPQRRFAMHIVKYATRPGTWDLASPYACSILVWKFTDQIFSILTDFAEEWGSLQQKDLLLGPCTNVAFQKVEIKIASQAMWLASPAIKAHTAAVYKENRCPDLSEFCGFKKELRWIHADIERVIDRWKMVDAILAPAAPEMTSHLGDAAALTAGFADLLAQQADTPLPPADLGLDFDHLAYGEDPVPAPPAPPPVIDVASTVIPAPPAMAAAMAAPVDTVIGPVSPKATPIDVTDLLLQQAAAPVAPAPAPTQSALDDLLAVVPVTGGTPAPSLTADVGKPGSSGETVSFEDLLAGLG